MHQADGAPRQGTQQRFRGADVARVVISGGERLGYARQMNYGIDAADRLFDALTGGNDITNLFSTAAGSIADGTLLSTFNSAANAYSSAVTFRQKSGTWSGNFTMPPGVGALYYNAGSADTVVTFVGQVQQGTYTVGVLPPAAFTLAGSPVPIGGDITNSTTAVGLVASAGDLVSTFNGAANAYNNAVTWSAKSSTWSGPMPVAPGQAFLYYNGSASAKTWVSNFTVQ